MRWIILTLLVANIALGGYLYWQTTLPEEAAPPANSARMNNLELDEATRTRLRSVERTSSAETESSPRRQPVLCLRITGLEDENQIGVIQSRLQALEVSARKETQQEVVRSDYWVVLGPFDSQTLAQNRLNELRNQKIESFLITQGRLGGAISLGLFSSRSNAERLVEQLKEKNVDARIEQVDRTRESTFLVIDQEKAEMISDDSVESIIDEFEGVSYQRYSC